MPIDKIYKPDVEFFHRSVIDAKRLATELHQRVAADQRRLAARLDASQSAIERSVKRLKAERQD